MAVLLAATLHLRAEGEKFPVLNAGAQTFSNVTVISQNKSDVYISHAGGFTNVKVKDLEEEIQEALGYGAIEAEPAAGGKKSVTEAVAEQIQLGNLDPEIQEMQAQLSREVVEWLERAKHLLLALCAVLVCAYLFACYCAMLVCRKTGNEPGPLIWIPVLQLLPLLKAAGMPAWAFVFWILPVSSPVVSVIWCFKICQARGKSPALGLLLLLPITNIITFLYLAFSGAEETEQTEMRPAGQLVLR